ncbi:MAG: hypothetical protein Q8916_14665, partial [Bacteroidota bacterium]|nr:hypothetical protein [Bacteroidota bacterium]
DVKQDLAQVPVQHQQMSTPAQSTSPASPVSPNQNSSSAQVHSNVASQTASSSQASARNFASARVRHEKQSNTNSDRSAVDRHASQSQHVATPAAKVETPAENVADNQNPVATPPSANKDKNEARDNSSKDNSVKENAPKAVAEKNTPPAPSAQTPPKDMASNDESVGSHEKNPLRDREEESSSRFPFAVRVYGSLGGSLVNIHANDAMLANHIEGAALLGLDYIIDPRWSVGVEGGNAAISQLISQSSLQSNVGGLPSISRVVVSNAVSNGSQFYARGVIRYTFNPQDRIHFEGSGGVGAAFISSFAPLVSAALYAGYDLNRNFAISAGLAFAGTWASAGTPNAAAQAVASESDPIGYVTVNHSSATLFTPSYGLRIGLKFRP